MRKPLTILLLVIFAVTQTEMGQLLKVPLLFEHYHQHHQLDHSLSFIDFLKDHYSKRHKDQKEDSKLPFLSTMSHSLSVAIVPLAVIPQKPCKQLFHKHYLLNDHSHLPQVFYSFFHPPRAITV